jgi:hypothetical protein
VHSVETKIPQEEDGETYSDGFSGRKIWFVARHEIRK